MPYREAPPRPRARRAFGVSSIVAPLALVSILSLAPFALWLFLWSRVTTVRCSVEAPRALVCDVDARSVLLHDRTRVEAHDVFAVLPAGKSGESRGDMWIEAVTVSNGSIELTPPFNGSKGAQNTLAERLDRALRAGRTEVVSAVIGSTTGTLVVPVFCTVGAILLGLVARAVRRVVVTREGFTATLRAGPFVRRPVVLDLSTLTAIRVLDPKTGKRVALQAIRADGAATTLFGADRARGEPIRRELEAFLLSAP